MRPGEYPAVKEIVARSFEDHLKTNPGALVEYEEEPWYDPEHLLVAEVDGKLVSQMGVRTGSIWVSGQPFPAGLVGTVCTLPEYRGKGIGAVMLREAGNWMSKRGLAFSYLHTSEARYGFYGRAGYRLGVIDRPKAVLRSAPDTTVARVSGDLTIRSATAADAGDCNRIYEAHYGRMSGAWSRTDRFWERRIQGRPKLWFTGALHFTVAEEGAPIAYVATEEGEGLHVTELASLPGREPAALALLSAVLPGPAEGATLAMGPDDPIWAHLGSCGPEDNGGQARVLVRIENLDAFLPTALKLLSRRADAVGVACSMMLSDSSKRVDFGRGDRRVELTLGEGDLCSLVYNGRRLAELLEKDQIDVRAGAPDDLYTLFPDTHPSRCEMDGY